MLMMKRAKNIWKILCACMAVAGTGGAWAQSTVLNELTSRQDGRQWASVGRLDIAGKGFCTASLIREDLILTAAHCIYDRDHTAISADRFTFSAGLREGRAEAYRSIASVVAHSDFRPGGAIEASEVAHDLALLRLSQPIRLPSLAPYPIAGSPRRGDTVGVVSYAKGREEAPSLQEICDVLGQQDGVIILTCEVDFGASGSPVFRDNNGILEIVSVVSAMSETNGRPISLGASLGAPLDALVQEIDDMQTGLPQSITPGQRRDTGAKFIRP